jgi:hypothetical protein
MATGIETQNCEVAINVGMSPTLNTGNCSTGNCSRCGGLLVREFCEDLWDDTGQICFDACRCVQCGNIIDPVIERNRLRLDPATAKRSTKWNGKVSAPILFNQP